MKTTRLEAFSDGVIAIAITIMVLELKAPAEDSLESLRPLIPTFAANVLSFINIGIYWNNHHHLMHATRSVDGRILWANMHLLFWLSLMPFTTAWVGKTDLAPMPTAAYGVDLLGCAVSFVILEMSIVAHEGPTSHLKQALGTTHKEMLSLALYLFGIGLAWVSTWISAVCYAVVAALWFVPDPRIERHLRRHAADDITP
ncbi:MAG TPA: TMEM175 family protein [Caulifigura sp.]|jgi:uncharacterized membrane protein|nr:TMEM175 family protein [Caulifigura sp.]